MTPPPEQPPGDPQPWTDGQTAIYHITGVENLASIAESGELLCDAECQGLQAAPVSIAYSDLKAKRAAKVVDVAAGGTLADYVPFYYAPRSPMLCVHFYSQGTSGYARGQEGIVHLVSCVQAHAGPGSFAITNGHPIAEITKQFGTLAGLDEIDWDIMNAKYWADTDEDGDRKRRRQAEFLAHRRIGFSSVRLVGAMTEATAEEARSALAGLQNPPPVVIRPDWYY